MKTPVLDLDADAGDETLMDEMARQDFRALEAMYLRYRPTLRAVLLKILGNPMEADDVLQDVFVQLWTRAGDYCPRGGRPLGWLITLARRRAIDRVRQRAAYQRATDRFEKELRHPLLDAAREFASVETAAHGGDLRELLKDAMRHIPEKQREALDRAFLDGMTHREVAADLRLPLGTVKTRIELGLRKLRSVLAGSRREVW